MRALDQTDIDILALLHKEARTNNKDIAQQIGLAPSTCLERIKKLQQDGIIMGSRLLVNYAAIGGHIQAMISLSTKAQDRENMDAFQHHLLSFKEVISVYHIGGDKDFLVHVSVSDTVHLRDFVFNTITSHNQVTHVETTLVYEHKISPLLPNF